MPANNALTERNARVAYARKLGIDQPRKLKTEALEAAIAEAEAEFQRSCCSRCGKPFESCLCDGDPFDPIDPAVEGDHLVDDAPESEAPGLTPEVVATREAWLIRAVGLLRPTLEQAGAANLGLRQISVSVGFPGRSIRKTIGQCWPMSAADDDKTTHMFISPTIDDGIKVLGTLAHEMIHADDNCESHHTGHFRRVATTFGLVGPMTATEVGPELEPLLQEMLTELGSYPHIKLNLASAKIKTQSTRMMKALCIADNCPYVDDNGGRYTVRLTRKWIDVGLPSCPCGDTLIVETVGE